jgi:hypothetical protein
MQKLSAERARAPEAPSKPPAPLALLFSTQLYKSITMISPRTGSSLVKPVKVVTGAIVVSASRMIR